MATPQVGDLVRIVSANTFHNQDYISHVGVVASVAINGETVLVEFSSGAWAIYKVNEVIVEFKL